MVILELIIVTMLGPISITAALSPTMPLFGTILFVSIFQMCPVLPIALATIGSKASGDSACFVASFARRVVADTFRMNREPLTHWAI